MANEVWSNERMLEWEKFWMSEMGQEALKKMRALKAQSLNAALSTTDYDAVNSYVAQARGVEMVLQDIAAGVRAAQKLKEGAMSK